MKIGTVICNHWASDRNPIKYFVYIGTFGKYAHGISLVNGKLEKNRYYKQDFKDTEKFEPVGFCDVVGVIKRDLGQFAGGGE